MNNVIELMKGLGRNIVDFALDISLALSFIVYMATCILSTWRIYRNYKWFKAECEAFNMQISMSFETITSI